MKHHFDIKSFVWHLFVTHIFNAPCGVETPLCGANAFATAANVGSSVVDIGAVVIRINVVGLYPIRQYGCGVAQKVACRKIYTNYSY